LRPPREPRWKLTTNKPAEKGRTTGFTGRQETGSEKVGKKDRGRKIV